MWLYQYSPGVTLDRDSEAAVSVVLAVERFRRDTGALPGSIADLVPKYLPALPRAAIGLVYSRVSTEQVPAGYRLYTPGWDGKDDGGDEESDFPIVGPVSASSSGPSVPADPAAPVPPRGN